MIAPAGAKNDSISNDARHGDDSDVAKGAISMQGLALSGTQWDPTAPGA